MVRIKNMGASKFMKYIQNRKLYIFGAGRITENCVDVYCQNKKVEAVLDNNEKLWGTYKTFKNQEIEIINIQTFAERIAGEKLEDIVMLVAPHVYAASMIGQLDEIPSLNGLNCYIHALVRNTKECIPEYDFSSGTQKIPKKIHYFWVGGKPIPDELQQYMNSWKVYNPDYEIIRWDESNYDFSKNSYMKEAYEDKAWGFVPDYARLDVIYQYGGIYLDTDVEVIHNLDALLHDSAFFGMGSADRIGIGVGFGGTPGNALIKELRDYYDNRHFINSDGTKNRVPCYYYQHPIFEKYGFRIRNEYQKINDAVVYPPEVMSPKGTAGMGDFFSEKTVSIHHSAGTWNTLQERKGIHELEELIEKRLAWRE